jgi:predicted RNase H-like HicB family nuclease
MPRTLRHYPVVLIPAVEGGFTAVCPLLPGCISQGDSRDEALTNIREAIELCLETDGEQEWPDDAACELVAVDASVA